MGTMIQLKTLKIFAVGCIIGVRGGRRCQRVEGHYIKVSSESEGGRGVIYLSLKKVGAQAPLSPP